MKNINDLSVYLKSFISKTIELTGSDSGYFSILNDENEILIIEHNNIENINIFNFRLLLGEGIEGWVLRKNVPLLIPNLKIDPRFHAAGYRLRSDIRSCICLPVESDSIKGTLTLFKNKDEFSNTDTKLIFKYIQNYKQSFEKAWNLARFEYLLDFTGTFNKITNKALDFNNQRQFIEYVKNKFKDLFHTDYFNICFKGEKFFDECSNDFKKCPAFINKIFQISAETNYCSQSKHNKDNILLCIPVKRSSMDFNGILSFQMPMNLYYRIKPFLNLKDIQDSLSLAFAKYSLESEIISSKGSVREENNFISCSLNILERTNYEGINSLCSEAVNCLTELFSPDGATLIVNEPNNSPIIIRRGLDEKIDHAFSKKIYETLSEIPDRILDIKSDKLNEKLRKKGITRFICAKLNDTKKQLGYIGFSFSKDPGDFNYKLFENASKILFYAIESSIKSRNNNNYIKELTNEIFKLRSEEKQLKFSSKQTENISQKLKSTRNKAEQSQNTLNLINQLYQISLNSKDISDTYKSILPAVIKHLKSNLATATIGMIDPSREKYKIVDSLGIKHSRINDFEKKIIRIPKNTQ